MLGVEGTLFQAALVLYLVALVGYLLQFAARSEKLGQAATLMA